MKKMLLLFAFVATFTSCENDDDGDNTGNNVNNEDTTVMDVDGNTYNTITMGNQIWMLENLKTSKLNDGTPIQMYDGVTIDNWNAEQRTLPLYQWASTDDLNNVLDEVLPIDYYGAMYNHATIQTGKLAPEGWRIPTEQDFIELRNYVASQGFQGNEGTALKSTTGWISFSGNGTNDFNFNGLANGYVDIFGVPKANTTQCTWATVDLASSNGDAFRRNAYLLSNTLDVLDQSILLGSGIRCIKIQN